MAPRLNGTAHDLLTASSTCRDRQRQLFSRIADGSPVLRTSMFSAIEQTACNEGHELDPAGLMGGYPELGQSKNVTLTVAGKDWLLEAERPLSVKVGGPILAAGQSSGNAAAGCRSVTVRQRARKVRQIRGTGG